MKKKRQHKKQTEQFVSKEIKQSKMANEDYQKIKAFFIALAVVLGLFGLLFFFNGNVVTKDIKEEETTKAKEPTFDASYILADDIFNKKEKEYLVLLFDTTDRETGDLFNSLFGGYRGEKALYGVDFSNKMNKKHFDENLENENTKPVTAEEVVVPAPRLLVIKDKKVSEYISDTSKIVEKMRAK